MNQFEHLSAESPEDRMAQMTYEECNPMCVPVIPSADIQADDIRCKKCGRIMKAQSSSELLFGQARHNSTRTNPWTLTQLWDELQRDLKLCQNKFEESNCKALAYGEIRAKAKEILSARKFTPMEEVIAKEVGAL